jgi:hypothetical protein
MPRQMRCSKCNQAHAAPRGKKCANVGEQPTVVDSEDNSVARILDAVSALSDRISRLETQPSPPPQNKSQPGAFAETRDRLRHLGLLDATEDEDEEDTDASDEEASRKSTKGKKSGKLRTASHKVKYELDWPHYYVYRSDAPATYDSLTTAEFTFGYLTMVQHAPDKDKESMREHLRAIMEDACSYKWETVRSYHAVVMNHIETGRLTWAQATDERLRRLHVWSKPQARQQQQKQPSDRSATACPAFQLGTCEHLEAHDKKLHVCSYCYKKAGFHYSHPEKECKRKQYAEKNGKQEGI